MLIRASKTKCLIFRCDGSRGGVGGRGRAEIRSEGFEAWCLLVVITHSSRSMVGCVLVSAPSPLPTFYVIKCS